MQNSPFDAVLYVQDNHLNGQSWFISEARDISLRIESVVGVGNRWTFFGTFGYVIQDGTPETLPIGQSDWMSFDIASSELVRYENICLTCNECKPCTDSNKVNSYYSCGVKPKDRIIHNVMK